METRRPASLLGSRPGGGQVLCVATRAACFCPSRLSFPSLSMQSWGRDQRVWVFFRAPVWGGGRPGGRDGHPHRHSSLCPPAQCLLRRLPALEDLRCSSLLCLKPDKSEARGRGPQEYAAGLGAVFPLTASSLGKPACLAACVS